MKLLPTEGVIPQHNLTTSTSTGAGKTSEDRYPTASLPEYEYL